MKRYALLLGLLAGCTGAGGDTYVGAPGSPAWFATASTATKAQYFGEICASYGYRSGTPEMAQCMQLEARSTRSDASARAAAVAAANSYRRPVQTNCSRFGNTVNCTSY